MSRPNPKHWSPAPMADPMRALIAWALLASAAAAAPPNSTSTAAALNGTAAALNGTVSALNGTAAQAEGGQSATVRLFNTLLITFGAIFLGTITVRLGMIEPDKGDLKAMVFYTGNIALPLLIFDCVATANLGTVNIATLVACFLAGLTVMALTGLLTYFAYKSYRSAGQQVLTATVFGFFTVATSDFALGFPVVQAIYGQSMIVYITANAVINIAFSAPLIMVFFSIGRSLLSQDGNEQSRLETVLAIVKELLLNPVISCTIAGLLYKAAFGQTLVRDGDMLVLPTLLHAAVKFLTAPFAMCALFLTGTSLRSVKMSAWPAVLVLMKNVVAACLCFFFAQLLVQEAPHVKERLVNFSFFWGSIPAGSAPLIFASQFDPSAREIISTAILLGTLLAAPVMFSTAVLLTDKNASVQDVDLVQASTIVASLVCGAFFLTLLGVLRQQWGLSCPAKKLLALYGVILVASELLALFFNPWLSPNFCTEYNRNSMSLPSLALGWMQSTAALIRLVLQLWLVFGPTQSPDSHGTGRLHAAACLGLALLAAVVTSPATIDQICHRHLTDDWRLISQAVLTGLLLVASVALAVVGICRKRRDKREKKASSGGNGVSEDMGWVSEIPRDVLVPISALFILQLLMHFINNTTVLLGIGERERPRGSFLLMLMLEAILTHGQLVVLTLAIFLSQNLTAHAAAAAPRLCPCLCRGFYHVLERRHTWTTVSDSMPEKLLLEECEASEDGEETQSSAEESEDSSLPHA